MALNISAGLNTAFDANFLNNGFDGQDYPWVPITAASPNATVNLTGVAGTGQVGTVTIQIQPGISGNAGTGAVGSVTPQIQITPTGVAGTGQIGTVSVSTTGDAVVNLTGVAGTSAIGTVGIQIAPVISGVAGTGAAGTITPQIQTAITGVAGTGQIGTVSISTSSGGGVSVDLSGLQATGQIGTVTVSTEDGITGHGYIYQTPYQRYRAEQYDLAQKRAELQRITDELASAEEQRLAAEKQRQALNARKQKNEAKRLAALEAQLQEEISALSVLRARLMQMIDDEEIALVLLGLPFFH